MQQVNGHDIRTFSQRSGKWAGCCNGHSYHGASEDSIIDQAIRDPRNDPHDLRRSSRELTEVRTVCSRARASLKALSYGGTDVDHDEIASALAQVVHLLERWDRP